MKRTEEPVQHRQQLLHVGEVQAGSRLIEDVDQRHRARRLPPHPPKSSRQHTTSAYDNHHRTPPLPPRGTGIRKPTAYRDAFPWERVSHAEPYVARAVTAPNLELSEARNRNRDDMSRTNHARQQPWLVPEKGFTEGTALGIGQLMADKTASG